MKKSIATALICVVMLTTSAVAQHRHDNRGRGGSNWVAPLVGGLIVGGVVGSMMQQRPAYGHQIPPYRTECREQPVHDTWNRFLGYEQVCYQVPNY